MFKMLILCATMPAKRWLNYDLFLVFPPRDFEQYPVSTRRRTNFAKHYATASICTHFSLCRQFIYFFSNNPIALFLVNFTGESTSPKKNMLNRSFTPFLDFSRVADSWPIFPKLNYY